MKFLPILFISLLLISCGNSSQKKQTGIENSEIEDDKVKSLTQAQEDAFDALDVLQMRTDETGRLYSTFPNHTQPCYPADSSFQITQSDFLEVMKIYTARHCKNMPEKRRQMLTDASVKASEKYNVLLCGNDKRTEKVRIGFPMFGTWVLPNVLGRRDIILTW